MNHDNQVQSNRSNTPRVPFSRLHSNDRGIYDFMLKVANDETKAYTAGMVRATVRQMLMGNMHPSLRVDLENLVAEKISKESINDTLGQYEERLCRIAPAVLPNEPKEEYMERTNLPEYVVDDIYDRGDAELL